MFTGMVIKEAIASVALEHPRDCRCRICQANAGDVAAFAEVWMGVQDGLNKEKRS